MIYFVKEDGREVIYEKILSGPDFYVGSIFYYESAGWRVEFSGDTPELDLEDLKSLCSKIEKLEKERLSPKVALYNEADYHGKATAFKGSALNP